LLISGSVGPGDHDEDKSSIWLVSILGGSPRRLRGDAYGARVSPDDSMIAFETDDEIWLADADGDNPRRFFEHEDEQWAHSPEWSWDGERIVYFAGRRDSVPPDQRIECRDLDGGPPTVLAQGYTLSGSPLMLENRLVYSIKPEFDRNESHLWQLFVDPDSCEPRGEPQQITDWVGYSFDALTATRDGTQLAFLNNRSQPDVFVGQIEGEGSVLRQVERLTLDDRPDWVACWTPDSLGVVFGSARSGGWDLFRQNLDQRTADDFALGPGSQWRANPTPDGKSFLYWEGPEEFSDDPNQSKRLLRIPSAGGPTEFVLEAGLLTQFDCASAPADLCLLFEPDLTNQELVVSRLVPTDGKGDELWRIEIDLKLRPDTDLAPDGSNIAVVGHQEKARTIRLVAALTGEVIREIEVDSAPGLDFTSVTWSPDSESFYLTGDSPRGAALLHVDMQGKADVLLEEDTGYLFKSLPSPDGRHLAFNKLTSEANVWIVENF